MKLSEKEKQRILMQPIPKQSKYGSVKSEDYDFGNFKNSKSISSKNFTH